MGKSARVTCVAAAVAALCACPGRSGTGGDRSGGAARDGGIVVSRTEISFVYILSGAIPSPVLLSGSWTADDAASFGAAYLNGGSKPSWLSVPGMGSASGHEGTLSIGVDTAGATEGTRSTTFQVGIARADGAMIGYRDVTVTLAVKAFGATDPSVTSSGIFGSSVAPAPKALIVSAPSSTAWTATSDRPAWLHVSPASGGNTPAAVTVSFDPATLGTGTYHGNVILSSGSGKTDIVPVMLTVANPTITITPSPVALAGLGGYDLTAKPVLVSINTGANTYPYAVTSDVGWAELAQVATSVSATPALFTATPSAAAADWDPGPALWGKLTVDVNVKGVHFSGQADVSYLLDDRKLLVSEDGVALTSTPSLSRLQRSVRVRTNRGGAVSWTATSDRRWLAATQIDADTLQLTADPSGLANDTLRVATVTVASDDPSLAHTTEKIRVGLWVGSVTPDAVTTWTASSGEVAIDPVRPYAYFSDGSENIFVLHLHRLSTMMITVPGASIGSMVTSSDGTRLWALDMTPPRKIVPVDLSQSLGTPGVPWTLPASASALSRLAFARTNGVGVLLSSTGSVFDPDTGASVAVFPPVDVGGSGHAAIAASSDGSRFCALDIDTSPYTLQCHDLAASRLGATPILVGAARSTPWTGDGNGRDLALSPDGRRLYVASGYPYSVAVFDTWRPGPLTALGTLSGVKEPTAMDVGPDGRLYCGGRGGPETAWVYGPDGAVLASYPLSHVVDRIIAVSGDGLRLVVRNGTVPSTSIVNIVTLPAP